MLRSLINDPENKNFMQPKDRKNMSVDELHYVDVASREREQDLLITRYRRKVERDLILKAAQADTKK